MLKDLIGAAPIPEGLPKTAYLTDLNVIAVEDLTRPESQYLYNIDRAIASAQATLEADLVAFLSRYYAVRSGFSGQIGNNSFTQMQISNASLTLPTRDIDGAVVTISKLGRLVSQDGEYSFTLTKEGAGQPLYSVTLTIGQRSTVQHKLTTPWQIPCDGSTYVLASALPNGVQVGNNNVHCGCGSGLSGLLPYIALSGLAGGFLATLQTGCGYELLIDRLAEDSRYKRVLAWMMAYKTTEILCGPSLTGEVNRDNVLSGEDRQAAAAVCQSEYLNRLNWLKSEDLRLDTNGTCLQTKPAFGMSRGGIHTGY